ncbi:MAG TPA: ABC transporter permease, partial [Polyangiaceae bacterium]|nr:ABC transporter permease [Polyangiaceae bacterium]
VIVLMVYFAAISLVGTAAVGLWLGNSNFGTLQSGLAAALTPYDLVLFLVKGVGLGTIVGWLSCHFGLEVKSSPTEVPQQASRAVVMSLLGCVVYNTALTAGFYWLVGPPLPAP